MKRSFCASGSGYVPLELQRILRRKHGKIVRQRQRLAVDTNVFFPAWPAATPIASLPGRDLISSASKNVVKMGPRTSTNSLRCRLKTLVAGNVGGHQVGRKLNASVA